MDINEISEYLPHELGFYSDPYSNFGRLAMELWRACRLVVDTGIHQMRWTREEAIEYLVRNTPNPRGDCVNAIERSGESCRELLNERHVASCCK